MAEYRVLYVKPKHFPRSDAFSAESDVQAVRHATRLAGANRSELWCGDRKVKVLNAGAA